MQAILDSIPNKNDAELEAEAVICTLTKVPGWKESNFQVMTSMVNVFIRISKLSSFNKSSASLAITGNIHYFFVDIYQYA